MSSFYWGETKCTDRHTQEVLIQDGKIEVVAKDYLKDYGLLPAPVEKLPPAQLVCRCRTSAIWTEGFVNYAAILVEFFGAECQMACSMNSTNDRAACGQQVGYSRPE
jgi:hypothetical protein